MKPNILVLYYSQSGQMADILNHLLKDIGDNATIDFAPIEPQTPFPWPWSAYTFFDAMPETVARIAIPIKPISQPVDQKDYDLIILGYQPWFLNPSQPTTGFLKSKYAAVLKNKPVVTVVGCRNMWLHGQEQVKKDLEEIGANLVGNIVLEDRHPNLVSFLTIIRWTFTGKKEASGVLPDAGVAGNDISSANRFGITILKHINTNDLPNLQKSLVRANAVTLKPGLILLEQRGIKNFRYWAKFIREKGGPGDTNRKGRVLLFKRLLLVGIFVLSPLSSFTAFLQLQAKKKKLVKDLDYFKGVTFEEGRI
jgi:hypothetical protein